MPDDRQLRRQAIDRPDDLRAEYGVGIHRDPLLAGQLALLQQDAVGHADLADVME